MAMLNNQMGKFEKYWNISQKLRMGLKNRSLKYRVDADKAEILPWWFSEA
jgi:hypothetical protein